MTSYTKSEMDNYQRNVYENLQHNQQRRLQLQGNLQSQQRNHRLSRAAWLQGRWLEISEQERRAHIHNQKLLQDFQKAEDMLNDMVARTEAMNTIRVQYEQYLEENFPRWQQRLKDIRVSKKLKRVQQHLEEDEGIKTAHRSDYRGQHLFVNSPGPSQTSHNMGNTHQTANDIKQNVHLQYLPPTWLTGSQPFISGLPQNNFPKDYKNLQNIQSLNHPCYTVPGNSLHQAHPPIQQETPSVEHLWQGLLPTAAAPWPRFPVLNPMMDVPDSSQERIQHSERNKENVANETQKPNKESCLRVNHKRNGKESDRSSELDSRPVRLSVDHGRSSEGSAGSSEATDSGMQKQRKKKREGTKLQSTENGNKSQCSSTKSQDASESHSDTKISKPHQNSYEKYSSEESIIRKRNVDAVSADEDGQDESRSQEISQSNVMSGKKEGSEGLNINEDDDSDEDEIIVAKQKIRGIDVEKEEGEGTGEEEETGYDDEEVMRKRHEVEASDKEEAGIDDDEVVMGKRDGIEEEPEGERDVKVDIGDRETTEEDARENSFQDKNEGGNIEGSAEDDKKDNSLERDIHNSLEELYSDETEEDEGNNQEVDDYDDDDEVVVEKAHPWSRDHFDDHAKCSDDDDDIEGLLNPVNSQTQKEEDAEVTDHSNDEHSGSEEESLPQKSHHPAATNEPVDSDDEFDHFYD